MKQPKELLINYAETKVDEEWLHLILEAKQLGLTIDEIRTFFRKNTNKNKQNLLSKNNL
ncbi:anti-repressor SinI family protein [Ectobacillus sp. sgz5001026]|uniref:anti-repressor SinI family protein n=1 Tax=Ectobacillus sp. sgz5001026 TaxID=3242473 RepID=UPI0036D2A3D0